MSIEFSCPNCHKFLRVGDAAAGSQVRCPECQHISVAPSPSVRAAEDFLDPNDQFGRVTDSGQAGQEAVETTNPYASPTAPAAAGMAAGYSVEMARSKVSPPAIALMIIAGFGLLFGAFNAAMMIFVQNQPVRVQPANDAEAMAQKAAPAVGACIGALLHVIVLIGAMKMRKLQNYGLSMTASILVMLPCSACCVLGLPFGIWSIVVLNDAGVKRYFH